MTEIVYFKKKWINKYVISDDIGLNPSISQKNTCEILFKLACNHNMNNYLIHNSNIIFYWNT